MKVDRGRMDNETYSRNDHLQGNFNSMENIV